MNAPAPVMRVATRRARPGCREAYEALARGMIEDARRFPGFLGADLLPPEQDGDDHRIVTRFASEADMERWNGSAERRAWHERMRPVAEGDPEFRVLTGLEAWFAPATVPAARPPIRWRMALVTWLGIFPTASFFIWFVAPLLEPLPFLGRTAVLTGLIVLTMTYVVMPRLAHWLHHWLRG